MKKILLAFVIPCLVVSILLPANAAETGEVVYFDAFRRIDGKIEVKFILSKASDGSHRFSSTRGYSVVPDLLKKQCGTQRAEDSQLPKEYLSSPLYDFADKTKQLPVEKLPVFFATVVSAELARKGLAKTNEDSLPYHTCIRLLWEKLLGLQAANRAVNTDAAR